MIIFFSDLDKTLIYSYKHDIGNKKVLVELYEGREISYVTEKSANMMKKLFGTKKIAKENDILFVPTTTRTVQQYNRIKLPIEQQSYALTCNGGVLLVDGKEDKKWYKESLDMIQYASDEMKKGIEYLEKDTNRTLEVRNIKDLFVFTKSSKPDTTIKELKKILDNEKVDVFSNGVKVYIVPSKLTKGNAVKRFTEKIKKQVTSVTIFSAGDSKFDIPMLEEADVAVAPKELEKELCEKNIGIKPDKYKVFSEYVLDVLNELTK